jgi:phosphoenolpyruvate carboxykinase (GTP)
LRAHGDVGAVVTPTGLAPAYEDLRSLFSRVLGREYSPEDYELQFRIRVRENLMKINRMIDLYRREVAQAPQSLFDELEIQRERLHEIRREFGDCMSPWDLGSSRLGGSGGIRGPDAEAELLRDYPNALWTT